MIELGTTTSARIDALASCRDLDDVLAHGSVSWWVDRLFGPYGSRSLHEAFGDAVVATLVRPVRTFSSLRLAVALAEAELLDPVRLAQVLVLDDGGEELLPALPAHDLASDLRAVLGSYRDRDRRRDLVVSVFTTEVQRRGRRRATDARIDEVMTRAAERVRVPPWAAEVVDRLPVRVLRHLMEDTAYRLDDHVSLWRHDGAPPAPVDLFVAKVAIAIEDYRSVRLLGERLSRDPAERSDPRPVLLDDAQLDRRLREALRVRLCDAVDEREARAALTASLARSKALAPHGGIEPASGLTLGAHSLAAVLGEVAQLLRLGFTMPRRARDWAAVVADLDRQLDATATLPPTWADELHGTRLDRSGWEVRVPKTRRELVIWADYMGNCIASSHADDVEGGTEVIVGLFDGDQLKANAGIAVGRRRVFELLGRFNQRTPELDPVEEDLRLAVARLRGSGSGGAAASRLVTFDDALDGLEAESTRPRARAGGRGAPHRASHRAPHGAVQERAALDAHLRASTDDRLAGLAVLWPVGAAPAGAPSMVAALARFTDDGLAERVAGCRSAASLAALWAALQVDPLHGFLAHALDAACRHVRFGDERARVDAPVQLLRVPAVRRAHQLGAVQGRLCRALGRVAIDQPHVLDTGLRRAASLRWTLAIVRSGTPEGTDDAGPTMPLPVCRPEHWAWAWRCAPAGTEELAARLGLTVTAEPPWPGMAVVDDVAPERAAERHRLLRCPIAWTR